MESFTVLPLLIASNRSHNGAFEVKPGSLFPALHSMEEAVGLPRHGENRRTAVKQSFIG